LVFLLFTDVDGAGKRRKKIKPQNCVFKEKKHKNGNPCKPFWNIKKPVCHNKRNTYPQYVAGRNNRNNPNQSRFCNKKFCWKMVNEDARNENDLVPKGTHICEPNLLLLMGESKHTGCNFGR